MSRVLLEESSLPSSLLTNRKVVVVVMILASRCTLRMNEQCRVIASCGLFDSKVGEKIWSKRCSLSLEILLATTAGVIVKEKLSKLRRGRKVFVH